MAKIIDKIAFVFLIVIIFVLLIMFCRFLIENILLPQDYLFYEFAPVSFLLTAPLPIVASVFLACFCVYYFKKKITSKEDDFLGFISFWKSLGKWKAAVVLLWVVAIYISFTTLTYVTNKKIVVVKPWDLKGQEYSYSEVEKIETGFGSKRYSFLEHEEEGNFYYKITVGGKESVFHVPRVNPSIERFEEAYSELEEFDIALRKYNIPKKASIKGYDKCDLDKRYVDRFLRIIRSD